jgi:hypothetical protein
MAGAATRESEVAMFKRKGLAACAGVLLAGGMASQAQAAQGLQIDLKLAADSSSVITRMGQEINIEMWARVEGAGTATKRQGFQMLVGSFLNSGGGLGIFTPTGAFIDTPGGGMEVGVGIMGTLGNFNGNGSQRGWSVDLDGDGDRDLGGPNTDDTMPTGHVVIRADGMVQNTLSGAAGKIFNIQIGSLRYTVTDVSNYANTLIKFEDRRNAAGQQITGSALWQMDGTSKNPVTDTPSKLVLNGLVLTNQADVNARGNKSSNPIHDSSRIWRDGIAIVTFNDVASGVWTESAPPSLMDDRITYSMISLDSDFTGIVAFPSGFGAMTVTLLGVDTDGDGIGETIPAGTFNGGDSLNFGDVMVAGLPLAAYGLGVDVFSVRTIPHTDYSEFSLAIGLSTSAATFSISNIPEATTLSLLAAGTALLGSRRFRRRTC